MPSLLLLPLFFPEAKPGKSGHKTSGRRLCVRCGMGGWLPIALAEGIFMSAAVPIIGFLDSGPQRRGSSMHGLDALRATKEDAQTRRLGFDYRCVVSPIYPPSNKHGSGIWPLGRPFSSTHRQISTSMIVSGRGKFNAISDSCRLSSVCCFHVVSIGWLLPLDPVCGDRHESCGEKWNSDALWRLDSFHRALIQEKNRGEQSPAGTS